MKHIKEEILIKIKRKMPKNEQEATSDYTDLDEIKKNLDDMTIYISEHLELTIMKQIFFLINKDYPEGIFAIKNKNLSESTPYNIIVQQTILNCMRDIFQWAYEQTRMYQNWKWEITDLNNITIPNLNEEYKNHLEKCKINYQTVHDDLNYIMDYFITIKIKVQNQEIQITSSKKFNFIVRTPHESY